MLTTMDLFWQLVKIQQEKQHEYQNKNKLFFFLNIFNKIQKKKKRLISIIIVIFFTLIRFNWRVNQNDINRDIENLMFLT